MVPDSQEKVPNPDLKVAVDKALENLEKKRTQMKKKTSVKSKIKEKAEKSETTPKKTRTSKTKEETTDSLETSPHHRLHYLQ